MDALIQRFPAERDGDLRLCVSHGVAYQADMALDRVPYDDAYFAKYQRYEDTPIGRALNAGRCALLARHVAEGGSVLDIGAGCGTFVRAARSWGYEAKGFDIIPQTIRVLRELDLYDERPERFESVSFWDSLEHMDDPAQFLGRIYRGSIALVAIPLFHDLGSIRASKHYRPGEHLYYFTPQGFIDWMSRNGFDLVEESDHELKAGRESIGAFAFLKL